MVGLYFDALALRKQVEALYCMGGQALAGADVGMVAADQVDVFTGGVQLALLGRAGDAGRGGLDQTGFFQVFEGVFQTAPLGCFIGVVVFPLM